MEITTVGFLATIKRVDVEKTLKSSALVDDYDIEDLDKVDGKKDIMIVFKTPIDSKFVGPKLQELLGKFEKKIALNDE